MPLWLNDLLTLLVAGGFIGLLLQLYFTEQMKIAVNQADVLLQSFLRKRKRSRDERDRDHARGRLQGRDRDHA